MKRFKNIYLLLFCLLTISLYSCKNEEKEAAKDEPATETASSQEIKESMAKSADVKYNPAHGEEGHRCDLPVGAPLDNTDTTAKEPMTSSPVRMQGAAPKINPPHGEPGHDCSVAVGAELN